VPVLPPDRLEPEARRIAAAIQSALEATAGAQPVLQAPRPQKKGIAWDDKGALLLPLPDAISPDSLEHQVSKSAVADRVPLWRALIPELATDWAIFPCAVPRSWGKIFLGPKQRLIYWPRALNRLFPHIPVAYDSIMDLVRALGAKCGLKMDLKAAFRSILIADGHTTYFGACLDGVLMEFTRLPFGATISPAVFVHTLAATLTKFRASMPQASFALAAFVDDLAPVDANPLKLLQSAERLVLALISDGWWLAIRKTFLLPACPLYYTGLLADFTTGTVSITAEKAETLRRMLVSIRLPSKLWIERTRRAEAPGPPEPSAAAGPTTPKHGDATRVRVSSARASAGAYVVSVLPYSALHWVTTPDVIVLCEGAAVDDSAWPGVPRHTQPCEGGQPGWSTRSQTLNRTPPCAVVIPRDDHMVSEVLTSLHPTATAHWSVIVAIRATDEPPRALRWFDAADALPDYLPIPAAHRRKLPQQPPTRESATQPPNEDGELTADCFAALERALGLLSWFATVIGLIGAWRRPLDDLLRTSKWTRDAVDSMEFFIDLADLLPHWPRRTRWLDIGTLLVIVDASRYSWGAVLTRPDTGARVFLTGEIGHREWATPSGARETWGLIGAVRAAMRRRIPFSRVKGIMDNTAAVGTAMRAGSSSAAMGDPRRTIAAWSYQGLDVETEWEGREEGMHPMVDALSPLAAAAAVWPLRGRVASCVWTITGGWDAAVGPNGQRYSDRWVTATPPSEERRSMLQRVTAEAGKATEGWIGDVASAFIDQSETALCTPAWSELPALVERLERNPFNAIIVLPNDIQTGEWWQPHLVALAARCQEKVFLGKRLTKPPRKHPGTPPHDPRTLAVYIYRLSPAGAAAASPRTRGVPAWWRTHKLTADGVERNPGPGDDDMASFLAQRTVARHRQAQRRPPQQRLCNPVAGGAAETAGGGGMAAFLVSTPTDTGPATTRRRLRDEHHPADLPPADRDDRPRKRPAVAPTQAAGPIVARATTQGTLLTARPALLPAAAPLVATAAIASIADWLNLIVGFNNACNSGIADDDIPESLVCFLELARATIRRKAMLGSRRTARAPRYLLQLATGLGDSVMMARFSMPVVDVLATTYAIRRLEPSPPFGWRRCEKAATVKSDLSAVATCSRRAGITAMPPVCGLLTAQYLAARGAGDTPEHSNAWPIHLNDLIAVEPPAATDDWFTWAALILMCFMCLRPGILPHLVGAMFVAYDGGFIFCWRYVSKTTTGDVLDPELRSRVVRVSAARHEVLSRVMTALYLRTRADGRLLPDATSSTLSAFITKTFPAAPKGFQLRTYGIRVAADLEAIELGVPGDLIDVLFWWRRLVASTRLYYGGLSVHRMFQFSEVRTRLAFVHFWPGRYDARLKGAWPNFTKPPSGHLKPLPPQMISDLDAAWAAEAHTVADERERRATRTRCDPLWQPLPRPAQADPNDEEEASGDGSDVSVDCFACKNHMDRRTTGTLCSRARCKMAVCTACHPATTVGILCTRHDPSLKTK
jgi:hypothetical protein